jgi:hypothetical protein
LHFILHLAYINSLNMCWTLNHQNILEMVQGHISLSNLAFSLLVSSSARRDSAYNIDTLPPSPHQQMGKLLVGPWRHLSLANLLGSNRAVTNTTMVVACRHRHLLLPHLLPSLLPPVAASPTPSHDRFDDSPQLRADAAQSTYSLSPALL